MAEYHVGCGVFGIYAGTLMPNGTMWRNRTQVTDEAICAVRDYLMGEFIKDDKTQGGYEWTTKDGRTVTLMIKVEPKREETHNVDQAGDCSGC